MTYLILTAIGFIAGLLSGAMGFGGGMIILPAITYFYGVGVAVPISTVAQLMSNLSKAGMGLKSINWKQVGMFLILAAPFTALGAFGFAKVSGDMKPLMTRILCIALIIFAIIKLTGKIRLSKSNVTTIVGGGLTGFVNGMLGLSGPMSGAVFLSLGLAPVSYIASEATAAAMMHVIKAIVYHKFALLDWHSLFDGVLIGVAMMLGNWIAMRFIRNVDKKKYQKYVAAFMIAVSVFLFITVK